MIHLPPCLTLSFSEVISTLSAVVDVKSWLVMFGFQLSNIIPGFPRHTLYFVEPPYELQATQHCENGQVRSAVHKENMSILVMKSNIKPIVVIQLLS